MNGSSATRDQAQVELTYTVAARIASLAELNKLFTVRVKTSTTAPPSRHKQSIVSAPLKRPEPNPSLVPRTPGRMPTWRLQ